MNIELNEQEINSFLDALGKHPSTAKTRAFYPKDHPRKPEDRGRKGGLSMATMLRWQQEQRGLYLVIGNGGHKDAEITDVPALFIEWDDKPRDWQVTAWRDLGLPEPSLQVDTAGRSIHTYWILDWPMEPVAWRLLQRRLLDYAQADMTISNPSRVMRLPGSCYIGGDGQPVGMVQIIHDSGLRYSHEDIESCLPAERQARTVQGTVQGTVQVGRAERQDAAESGVIPLLELLPKAVRDLALAGAGEGGRNRDCFRLAAVAIAVVEGAAEAGVVLQGGAEDLVLDFAARCTPALSEREALACLRSAESQPRTADPGLAKRIDYHTKPRKAKVKVKKVASQAVRKTTNVNGAVEPAETDTFDDEDGGNAAEPPRRERQERLDRIPIVCLGFNGDDYFYQSGDSGQVTRITKQAHSSSTSLIGLADLGIWEQVYPRYNGEGEVIGVSWKDAVNELFRKQHRVGIFDPTRIRGVGAWMDDGRNVFHLGDRLLVGNDEYSVFDPPVSRYLYQRLTRRVGPSDASPLSVTEGQAIIAMAERFHWEEPISGTLLAGWIALAPICGAIEWRPHIWLQAVAGSGKTTVLNRFISPLLSDLKLKVLGCTTEAGIRQRLKCDAIPVIFDESESNLKRDAERIQSVLSLARIASSDGDSVALKGSAGGDSMQFTIRSMFLLSSIATALRQGADESRFCVLSLRVRDELTAEEKDRLWRQLDADLIAGITEQHGQRLAARMIKMVPVVRAATRTFARAAALELGSARSGDQIGALLAGAWALWNDEAPTEEQAVDLIHNADWGVQRIQAEESGGDQRRCLDTILQHRLRVEVDRGALSRTVSELIELATGVESVLEPISPSAAEAELGRNGIRVHEGRLFVSNTARGVAAMLRDTPWADQGWGNLLGSLPGAIKCGPTRFRGIAKTSRCVSLPKSQFQPGESAD